MPERRHPYRPSTTTGDICHYQPGLFGKPCWRDADDPIHAVWPCLVDEACYHSAGPCTCEAP